MPRLGKAVEALVKAQRAAELLRRYEENKDALRRPPARPGRDETDNPNLLSDLADFVSDQDAQGQTVTSKRVTLSQFRRQLRWLYDMIDDAQKTKRFRTTGNTFQVGRFYTFNYVPRHESQLEIWDARPIILCLNPRYATHYYKKFSKRPNIGMLGINWHYVPMRARRRIMKQLIHDHSGNRARFMNNQAIDVGVIESLAGVYNALPNYRALRQYLRAGRYTDKNGNPVSAGAFNVMQIPYNHLTEILEVPSIYDAGFVGGKPEGV